MPRACSTLLQNIFNQRDDTWATPTDGLIELLAGARNKFTESEEFMAAPDQDLVETAWRNFAHAGLHGYANTLTDKENIVIKGRGWKGNIEWTKNILGEDPKIIVMVRNLKSICASFEKLYRKNYLKNSQWVVEDDMVGTNVTKRCDMYTKNHPLGLCLDRVKDIFHMGLEGKVLFVRAEDLTNDPEFVMDELYKSLNLKPFKHNFNHVEQTTKENDVIHKLDNNLHTIRNKVEPLVDDYEKILGEEACCLLDENFGWYQKLFKYRP